MSVSSVVVFFPVLFAGCKLPTRAMNYLDTFISTHVILN